MSAWSAQPRRMPRRSIAVAVTCLLTALLAGCTPPPAAPPSPTPTAIFASEEEALAAATDVFQSYLAAYDAAMARGGTDLSGVEDYVGPAYLQELQEPGIVVTNGWHTTGVSTFEVKEVKEYVGGSEAATIVLNVCRDVRAVKVLDSAERDVTPATRLPVVPLTVSFAATESRTEQRSLIISEVQSWLSPDACIQ